MDSNTRDDGNENRDTRQVGGRRTRPPINFSITPPGPDEAGGASPAATTSEASKDAVSPSSPSSAHRGKDHKSEGDENNVSFVRGCLPQRPDSVRFVHRPEDGQPAAQKRDALLSVMGRSLRKFSDPPNAKEQPDFSASSGKTNYDPNSMRRVSALLWDHPSATTGGLSAFNPDKISALAEYDSDSDDGGAGGTQEGRGWRRMSAKCTVFVLAAGLVAGVIAYAVSRSGDNETTNDVLVSGYSGANPVSSGKNSDGREDALPSGDGETGDNVTTNDILVSGYSGVNPVSFDKVYDGQEDALPSGEGGDTFEEGGNMGSSIGQGNDNETGWN